MRIIVCIKQVPGTNHVEIDETTGAIKRSGIPAKMNPYDLFAIETALRIKDEYGGEVMVVTMGPPQAESILKEAILMGADGGYLLSDRRFAGADVLATSYTLSQGIKETGNFDLIICGKQTTDGDTAQVGSELAELLDIPNGSNISQIHKITGNYVEVSSEMETCVQKLKISLPCLLSVEKDIYKPRDCSEKLKKEYENKAVNINTLCLDNFGDKDAEKYGFSGSPTKVEKCYTPAGIKVGEKINGSSDEVTEKLVAALSGRSLV